MKTVKKIIFSFILFVICFSLFSIKTEAFSGIKDSLIWDKWQDTMIYYKGISNYDGIEDKKIGLTVNKYYTANETLFCIDSHLDGPSINSEYTLVPVDNKLSKAYLEIYKYYMNYPGNNVAYITANIAARLITLEYNISKTSLTTGGKRIYGPGSQFNDKEWNPIRIYQNTLDIVNELLKSEGNSIDYGSSLDSFFVKYENKNSKRSTSMKGLSGEGNDGKGILKNAILQYIKAKKKYEESSSQNTAIMPNLDVSSTAVEAVENGNVYTAEFTVQASSFNISEGEYTNPKVEKIGNTYTSIEFIEQPPAGTKYDKTSIFKVRVTISKNQIQSAGINEINIPFRFSFQYTSEYSLSNVSVASPGYNQTSTRGYPLQRMLIFKNTTDKKTESVAKDLTIKISIPTCQIKDKEDGTKEYYDLNGTLINKGSEEANLEEYNRVCKLCFQSPELDPNSPEFNKEMFDKRGCCYMFDPDDINADPGHKEYYNKFCARMCYVTPELNPDSYEFDQSAFKDECCNTPPTNAAQLEHYNTYCVKDPCAPTIEYPYCSDASSSRFTIKDPDDWDRCIFNNKDVAGNSYNISGYENNPYCKIACNEEYEIEYPGRINNIKAGQYFVLTTSISKKRTCKTTEIRNDKFESDVEDLIDDVLEAYNNWIEYKEAADATYTTSTESCSYSGKEEVKCTPEEEDKGTCTPVTGCDSGSDGMCTKVSFTWTYTTYSIEDGELVPKTNTKTSNTGGKSAGACSCSCKSTTYPEDFEAERDRLSDIFDDKKIALNNAFNYIKSCSSFDNDEKNFKFEPDIRLEYEEDYYMNMIKNLPNENKFISSEDVEIKTDVSHYVGTQNYGESSQTRTVKSIACSESGCHWTYDNDVPKNTRIEKVATVDQTMYKPATVFYSKLPTGEMKGFQNGNKPKDEYVKVGQVFPIAMTTPKGTYTYKIIYGNLGQYNEDDSTGRFTGPGNSVYQYLGESNEYVCNYNVVEDICLECFPNPGSNPNPNPSGGGTLPGGFAYFYRLISLYDVFPNSKVDTSGKDYLSDKVSRTIGKNWTSVKGVFTQKRIEENNAGTYGEAEYSFTLTPANMMAIRNYNKTHQYNDFNLVCNSDGIDCTSNFIRDGLQEGYFSNATLNNIFIHANDVEHDSPRGLEICDVGETNNLSCVGPSWK